MTTVRWATTPRGGMANPGKRWLAALAALVVLAGLAHVWLHYSGTVDADHFGQNIVDDCLLCEMPLAVVAASSVPLLPVLFIAAGTARPVPATPDHWRPPVRAPPLS